MSRTLSPALILVAFAAALLAAGCGGAQSPGVASIGGGGAASTVRRSWAAFYHCWAVHGFPSYREIGSPSVPSAPPISGWSKKPNGHYVVTPAFMKMSDSAKFKAAGKTCYALEPGSPATPAEMARRAARARKFSECVRAHDMPDFPDPDNAGTINLQAAGIDWNAPAFQRAKRACQSLDKNGVTFYAP